MITALAADNEVLIKTQKCLYANMHESTHRPLCATAGDLPGRIKN